MFYCGCDLIASLSQYTQNQVKIIFENSKNKSHEFHVNESSFHSKDSRHNFRQLGCEDHPNQVLFLVRLLARSHGSMVCDLIAGLCFNISTECGSFDVRG